MSDTEDTSAADPGKEKSFLCLEFSNLVFFLLKMLVKQPIKTMVSLMLKIFKGK